MILRRWWASAVCAVLLAALVPPPAARADAVRAQQWYLHTLGIDKAWSITRGAGVTVSVIDTGIDGAIPDLRGAVVGGKDFSGMGKPNGQGPVGDPLHGTGVASVLAGRGDGPGDGVIGSAPQASLLSASIYTGVGSKGPLQEAAAIRWSTDAGAKIINISGGSGASPQILDKVAAAVRYAEAHDVVVVAATGNDGSTSFMPPAALPGVVAVTGVDRDLHRDPKANYGRGVAIAGPYSTTPTQGMPIAQPPGFNGPYTLQMGTSLATPIVAGIIALIRARYPHLDAANVINRLVRTATPAGGAVPNDRYGYGIPNAYRALTAHVAPVTRNPLGSLAGPAPSAPPSGGSRSTTAPPAPATSAPTAAAATHSAGPGAAVWAALAVVVLAAVALVGWLLARRRPRTGDRPRAVT